MSEIKKTQSIAENWHAAVETGAANQPNRVTAEESGRILEIVKGGMGVSKGELAAAETLWGDVKAKYDAAVQAHGAAREATGAEAFVATGQQLRAFLDTVDGLLYLAGKVGAEDPIAALYSGDQKAVIESMRAELQSVRDNLASAIENLSAAESNLEQATALRDAIRFERGEHWSTTRTLIDSYFETHPAFTDANG